MDRPAKILIVDDEPFNVDLLEQELEELDHDTISASNGVEALKQVAAEAPDMILLDIMMPEMDGFGVIEHLKRNWAWRDIPIIVVSALDDMASVVRGIELGAEEYLPKPWEPALLKARISACLEKKRLRDKEVIYLQQIETEKKRSDELLHVILPPEIVHELKITNTVKPRKYENVAVLFTDIVGFTPYCDSHSPDEVVNNLQQLVELYEDTAIEHELQKIKTVGDAFMATGGLLHKLDNPVENCVECGLKMIDVTKQLSAQWQVRVGIDVGTVVAGIVGHRQYLFDLWGDTVNTAQRIESHGTPDRVNVSSEAWELVSSRFRGQSLGLVQVKGKDRLEIIAIEQ